MNGEGEGRWLLLIHQIPPKPDYFRVKIWRRLQNLGAAAIKNSVYVLPNTDQAHEDFQWIVREIVSGGGEAMVCEARLIEGLSDSQVVSLFRVARDRDYRQIAAETKKLAKRAAVKRGKYPLADEPRTEFASQILRLQRQMAEITAIDFFEASGRKEAEERIADLVERLRPRRRPTASAAASPSPNRLKKYRSRTWVTRQGIHVDRIASAWLIRRFIDQAARFKFVSPAGYRPRAGEIRFDMFEAEFTHEGDGCTFEVLCGHFGLNDPALRVMAEIVHDIDLKDSKYGHPETAGISRLIAGISMNHKEDEARLPRSSAVFDDLYECFRRQEERPSRRGSSHSQMKSAKGHR
jgi:hypothetical protein